MTTARITVKVTPRASRSTVVGWRDGTLLLKVTAPPVDSAANAAVIELLARALDIPKRDITIVRGETARTKLVEIDGLKADEIRARL